MITDAHSDAGYTPYTAVCILVGLIESSSFSSTGPDGHLCHSTGRKLRLREIKTLIRVAQLQDKNLDIPNMLNHCNTGSV